MVAMDQDAQDVQDAALVEGALTAQGKHEAYIKRLLKQGHRYFQVGRSGPRAFVTSVDWRARTVVMERDITRRVGKSKRKRVQRVAQEQPWHKLRLVNTEA